MACYTMLWTMKYALTLWYLQMLTCWNTKHSNKNIYFKRSFLWQFLYLYEVVFIGCSGICKMAFFMWGARWKTCNSNAVPCSMEYLSLVIKTKRGCTWKHFLYVYWGVQISSAKNTQAANKRMRSWIPHISHI